MLRPRLLIVGNFLSGSGGSRSVCEELAGRFDEQRWHVLTTSRKPARLPRLLDICKTIWLERRQYDVAQVDVYSGRAFFVAELACCTLRAAGKPFVLTLHGGNLPQFARRWPRRVRRLLASAAAVTTPSRYLLEQMQPYRHELLLLPNAVDVGVYPTRIRRAPMPRLIWLRAFNAIYNPSLAPRVVALLRPHFPDIHLTMIGPDKGDGSLPETRRVVERLGLRECITFVAGVPKSEVPERLAQADVFLNTTNVDNTPVSLLEALACGLCAVSTNVGGIPYLVRDEEHALLVPPGNAEAMATAVRRILTDARLAEQLSASGRREAERYDWPVTLEAWNELLTTLASGASQPLIHPADSADVFACRRGNGDQHTAVMAAGKSLARGAGGRSSRKLDVNR